MGILLILSFFLNKSPQSGITWNSNFSLSSVNFGLYPVDGGFVIRRNLKRTFSPLCSEIKLRLACLLILSLYVEGFCPKLIYPLEWQFSESQLYANTYFDLPLYISPQFSLLSFGCNQLKPKALYHQGLSNASGSYHPQCLLSGGNFPASPTLHLWRLFNKIYPSRSVSLGMCMYEYVHVYKCVYIYVQHSSIFLLAARIPFHLIHQHFLLFWLWLAGAPENQQTIPLQCPLTLTVLWFHDYSLEILWSTNLEKYIAPILKLLSNFYLNFFFKKYFIYSWETQRQRQRHWQREKQAPCREPDEGFDSGTLGSYSEPKADAQPLRHPGIPIFEFL